MKLIGLTGGIACGKSAVSKWLVSQDVAVLDLDALVHYLQRPGSKVVAELGAAFPGVVADGALDRDALGTRIFDDAAERKRLDRLMRPHIKRALHLAAWKASAPMLLKVGVACASTRVEAGRLALTPPL